MFLLCPACNRVALGQGDVMYVFECEKRRLSAEAQELVYQKKTDQEFTALSCLQIDDPGPGLIGKLTIGYCLDCLEAMPPNKRALTVKYLDENREVFHAEQTEKTNREDAVAADDGFDPPKEE
jgi:hypothetical protein